MSDQTRRPLPYDCRTEAEKIVDSIKEYFGLAVNADSKLDFFNGELGRVHPLVLLNACIPVLSNNPLYQRYPSEMVMTFQERQSAIVEEAGSGEGDPQKIATLLTDIQTFLQRMDAEEKGRFTAARVARTPSADFDVGEAARANYRAASLHRGRAGSDHSEGTDGSDED